MDREQQIAEAEQLLGHAPVHGFVKDLFFGTYNATLANQKEEVDGDEEARLGHLLEQIGNFLETEVDPAAIDREARVPKRVVQRLFELGVMSMSIPREHGGLGFSQRAYCRVMEEIGAVDASIAVLINAHQSIGMKSLLLFGTPKQQEKGLPMLSQGRVLSTFALTEPNAGSDAAGIETRAVLNTEGTHYVLNSSG